MTYENKGKTTLEIIRALSQAANVYDGYHSRGYEGSAEYEKVGLKEKKVIRFLIKELWMALE